MATFFISDLHLGHKRMWEQRNAERAQEERFADIAAMDDYIIERWNSRMRSIVRRICRAWILCRGRLQSGSRSIGPGTGTS